MRLPLPVGDLSGRVHAALVPSVRRRSPTTVHDEPPDPLAHDTQLALWTLYELHYRGFDDARDDAEWDPQLIALRQTLEQPFEAKLRELTAPMLAAAADRTASERVDVAITDLVEADDAPNIASYIHRHADTAQFRDFMKQRSIFHLKETDAFSWPLPRLAGAPKVALAELMYDEYGDGSVERDHQRLFADALRGCGLDPSYGAYIDEADTATLVMNNAMSLFGLHRRLRGASVGYLAAFEATSSIPCRRISQGIDRLGLGDDVARYFDEHVEADAIHEHLAITGVCLPLTTQEPHLRPDILLGAATCLLLAGVSTDVLLARWQGTRATRGPAPWPERITAGANEPDHEPARR